MPIPVWWDDALALRDQAARPVFERIDRDLERAPARVKPLLEEIRRRLFDPELTIARLKRACGVGDNSISTFFRRAVGVAPRRYVEECRLATAATLMQSPRLPVWQVGEMLGFRSSHSFARTVRRGLGHGPSALRMEAVKRPRLSGGISSPPQPRVR